MQDFSEIQHAHDIDFSCDNRPYPEEDDYDPFGEDENDDLRCDDEDFE